MAKIVVVGAGFCGLSAALALRQAGADVTVLEARERVGGRVEAYANGLGEVVDTGGQFICDDMPEVMKLARRYWATLVESDFSGNYVAQPETSLQEAERARAGSTALRDRMNSLSPDDPSLSGMTVADWLSLQHDLDDVKAAFRTMIEGLWCVSLEIMPAWYLIDNDRRITNEVGELQYSLAGTMQSLADQLAEELGASVRLAEPATRIEHADGGVRVLTDVASYDADAVLVAVPPMTARRINYQPPLPPRVEQALGAWQSGAVIKVLARYARPFWREKGLSGMVMWREPSGLFAFDSSRDSNHAQLALFIGGPLAVEWSRYGEQAIRDAARAKLVIALGPEAGEPLDMTIRNWTDDRWSGGAYSDVIVDMAARDAESVIRTGAPPLLFASSELSPSFPGYIEGAIVAGRQAATGILSMLGDTD